MPRTLPQGAKLVLAVAGVACAAWLACADYAVGRDFEGAADVVATVASGDAAAARGLFEAGSVHAAGRTIAIERRDGEPRALPPGCHLESTAAIGPALPRWLGRAFATCVAALGAAAWLAGLRVRRALVAAVATLCLAWAGGLVELLLAGESLSRATYAAALALAVPAALAVALRARWPLAVLAAVIVASFAVRAGAIPRYHHRLLPYLIALHIAHRGALAVAAIVGLALVARPARNHGATQAPGNS
jgi:hypothetical protein